MSSEEALPVFGGEGTTKSKKTDPDISLDSQSERTDSSARYSSRAESKEDGDNKPALLRQQTLLKSVLNEQEEALPAQWKSKVPLVSTIILDPIARYKIYGTFPWKLLIHLCIVIVASGYGFLQHDLDYNILNPQIKVFYYSFLYNGGDMGDFNQLAGEYNRDNTFYTTSDLQSFISDTVNKYYTLTEGDKDGLVLANVTQVKDDNGNPLTPLVVLRLKDGIDQEDVEMYYEVTDKDLGPFKDIASTKFLLGKVQDFYLNYTIDGTAPFLVSGAKRNPLKYFRWTVIQTFSVQNPALVTVKLSITEKVMGGGGLDQGVMPAVYLILILLLGTWSLFLNAMHYFKMSKLFSTISYKYQREHQEQLEQGKVDLQSKEIRLSEITQQNQDYIQSLQNLKPSQHTYSEEEYQKQIILASGQTYLAAKQRKSEQQLFALAQAFNPEMSAKNQKNQQLQGKEGERRESTSPLQRNSSLLPSPAIAGGDSDSALGSSQLQSQSAVFELFRQNFRAQLNNTFTTSSQGERSRAPTSSDQPSASDLYKTQALGIVEEGNEEEVIELDGEFYIESNLNSWSQLPFKQKMRILDYWTLVVILSNLLHILGAICVIIPDYFVNIASDDLLIGLGTGLIWLSLMKYLQYSNAFYILPATMLSAGYQILQAAVSAIAIIVGLAFCCMGFFGLSWRFSSIHESIIMLFTIMNGDEVQNIYHNLIGVSFVLGGFFCYFWVFVSNNLITPTFLAISEDGYIKQSKTSKFEWLEDNIYNDPEEEKAALLEEDSEDEWAHLRHDDDDEESMLKVQSDQFLKKAKQALLIQNKIYLESQQNPNENDGFINHQISHRLHIQEAMQLSNLKESHRQIMSKRALQIILRVEEFDWNETDIRFQQREQISGLILNMIELRLEFNGMHIMEINKDFNKTFKLSLQIQAKLRSALEDVEEEGNQEFLGFNTEEKDDRELVKQMDSTNLSCIKSLHHLNQLYSEAEDFIQELEQDDESNTESEGELESSVNE